MPIDPIQNTTLMASLTERIAEALAGQEVLTYFDGGGNYLESEEIESLARLLVPVVRNELADEIEFIVERLREDADIAPGVVRVPAAVIERESICRLLDLQVAHNRVG